VLCETNLSTLSLAKTPSTPSNLFFYLSFLAFSAALRDHCLFNPFSRHPPGEPLLCKHNSPSARHPPREPLSRQLDSPSARQENHFFYFAFLCVLCGSARSMLLTFLMLTQFTFCGSARSLTFNPFSRQDAKIAKKTIIMFCLPLRSLRSLRDH